MRDGTCIHFTGLDIGAQGTKVCGAGVCYRSTFDDSRPGIFLRMPCVQYTTKPAHSRGTLVRLGEESVRIEFDRKGNEVMHCPLLQLPTQEQVEQSQRERDARLQRSVAAIQVASEWRTQGVPPNDRSGVVGCPVCNGRLHLHQSARNGHVHGRCETDGCVAWME